MKIVWIIIKKNFRCVLKSSVRIECTLVSHGKSL